jgi:hypothetical protein
MFDSLEERIRSDDAEENTQKQRLMRHVLTGVLSVVLFGGLYFVVRILD